MEKGIKKTYWYKVNLIFGKLGRKSFSKKVKFIIYTVIFTAFIIGNIIFVASETKRSSKDVASAVSFLLRQKERDIENIILDIENKAKLAIFSYLSGQDTQLKYFSVLNIDSVYIKDTDTFLIRPIDISKEKFSKNFRIFEIQNKKRYIVINIQKKNRYFVFVSYKKFLEMVDLKPVILPNINIPAEFFLTSKKISSKGENICNSIPLKDSNLSLIGCVKSSDIFKAVLITTLLKSSFVFIIIVLLVGIIYNTVFGKAITFPIDYLKEKIKKMNKIGLENVEFDLHKYTQDEFGEISGALEEARKKILSEREKLEIVKETTEKMSSSSTDIHDFAIYVANNIDKLLDAEGSVILLYSKAEDSIDLRAHSDNFLNNKIPDISINKIIRELLSISERNAEKYYEGDTRSIYGIKKEVNDEYFLFHIIFLPEKRIPKSEEISYIHTILNHLIYNINLLSLATYDPLTKLYNRRFIISFAETEVKEAKRYNKDLSIIILDIDNFKSVNDTYGHPAGDEVIKKVANILKTRIRETDKAGRYGGEEFIIILPNTPSKEALEVAERIRRSVENEKVPIKHNNEKLDLNVTVSVGVASLGFHGNSFYELLQAADLALYEAKRNGKNQVRILSREEVDKLLQEETEDKVFLEKAIDEDKIFPYFQPILDINTLEVIGYEVLARLEKEREIKSANKFITSSIKYGVAEKIDLLIQKKAIEVMAKKGIKDKYLFFNLSKAYIQNPSKIHQFEEFLFEYRFPSDKVVFEITEEEAINDMHVVKEVIRIAKERKMKFALDDFGTGYSNFIYLRFFDVEILKLDGSLIKNIDKDKDNQIIIEGIAFICRKKGIKLLAEMVETKEELETLREIGVDYVQGYYFGKPSAEPVLKAKGNVLYRVKKFG